MKQFITINEQGLRDGLQTLTQTIPTDTKLRWIAQLVLAGVRRIQVASFVNPKKVQPMADAADLFAQLPPADGVQFSALVLNKKGVERAIDAGVQHLAISLSASDTHSRKNTGIDLAAAKAAFGGMVQLARANGVLVRGGIQCAFGCRFEGKIDPEVVLDLARFHLDLGIDELALADSTGMANPPQLQALTAAVVALAGGRAVALHLHNTENKGYANVFAGIQAGVRHFDTAFGGLGGCPFIAHATGNIATEDTVNMLHQSGYDTGIDLGKIARISTEMAALLGEPLPGLLYKLRGDQAASDNPISRSTWA